MCIRDSTKNDSDGVGVLFGVEPGTVEQSGDPSGAASSSGSELGESEAAATSTSGNLSSQSSDDVQQSTGPTGGSNSQAGTSGPATTNSDITTNENGSIVDQNNLDGVNIVEATAVSGGGEATSESAPASAAAASSDASEEDVQDVEDAPTLETPEEIVNTTAAPTDIQFSNRAIDENSAGGTVIGTLSASDADSTEFTYQLVDGEGNPVENEFFEIVGDQIVVRAGANLDFETQATHDLRLEVTDESGNTFVEAFEICLLYTSPSPRDLSTSRMPSSA